MVRRPIDDARQWRDTDHGDVDSPAGRRLVRRTAGARAIAGRTPTRLRVLDDERLAVIMASIARQARRETDSGERRRRHPVLVARWTFARVFREGHSAGC